MNARRWVQQKRGEKVEAELARTDDKLTDPHAEVNYNQMSK
jgi:hypothetical protein